MRRGRRIQSRGLSTAKYKGPEITDEREEVEEVNRAFCGALQSQGNCL